MNENVLHHFKLPIYEPISDITNIRAFVSVPKCTFYFPMPRKYRTDLHNVDSNQISCLIGFHLIIPIIHIQSH